jgi:hypothetical protein
VGAAAEAGAEHWTRVGRRLVEVSGEAPDGEAALGRLLASERTALML